ncbi:hypothetical protein [Streptomyces alboflavus]|uniref:hypothetical protein n=1 Tax=Streptomyces alboflavus TaxID=67267 RepID=UPI00133169F2|nr:hypothetical protein [Streptomyces alboflavus]
MDDALGWARSAGALSVADTARLDEATAQQVQRATAALRPALASSTIHVVWADTLADLPGALAQEGGEGRNGAGASERRKLLVIAVADPPTTSVTPVLEQGIGDLTVALPVGLELQGFFYDVLVYTVALPPHTHITGRYRTRIVPADTAVWSADLISALADFAGLRLSPEGTPTPRLPSALAIALHSFLTARSGSAWAVGSYPGSVTARFITDLEELAVHTGNPVLRSPNEHGLAAGAMARWILDRAPFILSATSGMVDEFRGTLANLTLARARGFLLFADVRGKWFPFQGTVHEHENSHDVFQARGLSVVELRRPETLREDLARAWAAYDRDMGPVILMASPAVLAYTDPQFGPDSVPSNPPPPTGLPSHRFTVRADHAADVLAVINSDQSRLLWQCGQLSPQESDLCHELARRCGVALCDSLTRPGTVAKYRRGALVPEYLGTMGMYGYSAAVHRFLHTDGQLRPRSEQWAFFLKSRLAESATPFSTATLTRRLRTVQITSEPRHLAPFVTLPIETELEPFLRWLSANHRVDDSLLTMRRKAIDEARDSAESNAGPPVLPMTMGFFFHHLNNTIERLITSEGYTYTSMIDVGRGGASAVRNLARTGPGFSGWYGRSLMGDALSALPAIATSRAGHVLAFTGDAAWMLVPDVIPTLVQQICLDHVPMRGNLSIFRLINGAHSLVNTWAETRRHTAPNSNTMVLNFIAPPSEHSYGPVTVRHHVIRGPDDLHTADLDTRLLQPEMIDVYSVVLAHDNAWDGLSLHGENDWRSLPKQATHDG